LTEPYRHLNLAYAELTDAYGQLTDAYSRTRRAASDTRIAYEDVRAELDRVNGALGDFTAKAIALRLRRYPWRITKLAALVEELKSRKSPSKEEHE
jgi:hypothetical protein